MSYVFPTSMFFGAEWKNQDSCIYQAMMPGYSFALAPSNRLVSSSLSWVIKGSGGTPAIPTKYGLIVQTNMLANDGTGPKINKMRFGRAKRWGVGY